MKGRGASGRSLKDKTSIASKCNLATTLDPALIDGDGSTVVAKASGDVVLAGGCSDDEPDDAQTVGGARVLAESIVAVVVVEGASRESEKNKRNQEFVLWLGLDLAFGVEGQVLASSGVGSSERCLNVLRSRRENELPEVKVERAGAAEAAGWLSLGDGPNHGRALGNRDGVVGVIDRFRNSSPDLLPGFGGGRA